MPTLETTPDPELSILLVDDDVELCELLHEFFTRRGFRIESAHDGRRGLAKARFRSSLRRERAPSTTLDKRTWAVSASIWRTSACLRSAPA